jgi:hypothetical protein
VVVFGAWLGSVVAAVGAGALAAVAVAGAAWAGREAARLERLDALREGTLAARHIAALPPRPDFVARESRPGAGPIPGAARAAVAGDSPSAAAFREAATAMFAQLAAPPLVARARVAAPLGELRDAVTRGLDPAVTIAGDVAGRLHLPELVARQPADDPVEPALAAPQFPQPMYEALRDLSPEWLLPGVGRVSPNTVGLLASNQRFIEAYMVGLNQEMARELRWNEYPTDLRGTYFRQFWDPAGHVPPPGATVAPEALEDIQPIHRWGARALGDNSGRQAPPGGDHLVLLLRGDLLHRFPGTRVYAVRARRGADGRRELSPDPADERHPVFGGVLPPDVAFFGFELTAAEARGVTDASSPDQGWFFVFQEQPSEPRFGLDVAASFGGAPATWADLSWGHLGDTEDAVRAITVIDLDAPLPDTSSIAGPPEVAWHADAGRGPTGARASDLAYITMQPPVRVGVHGSDMIPAP